MIAHFCCFAGCIFCLSVFKNPMTKAMESLKYSGFLRSIDSQTWLSKIAFNLPESVIFFTYSSWFKKKCNMQRCKQIYSLKYV